MIKLGITGGIGSGKTTVCRIFSCLGIPVFDSDYRAKLLMNHNDTLHHEIIKNFGKKIIRKGLIDFKKLSDIVFEDSSVLISLNNLVHPYVRKDFAAWLGTKKESSLIVKEAAILIESGAAAEMDFVLSVEADEALRLIRSINRGSMIGKEIKKRMAKQLTDEERRKKSDFIISNNELDMLIPQVLAILEILVANTNSKARNNHVII